MSPPPLSRIVNTLRTSARVKADTTDSDHELLARFVSDHDEDAFRALVARHGKTVLAACRQVLADPADTDDAFQATFLVLLKKAKKLDGTTPLGGWLFAVAHRVAVRCRSDANRRRVRENEAASRKRNAVELPDLSWREAAAVLHNELNALPDKYRLPLLLCSVQGLTRDEAAEQLGTTIGAIRGQLERGRSLLERRLTRRGITLSAGLLVMVGGSRAAALPPVELIDATVRATSGHATAAVAALTHGAFPMTTVLKQIVLPVVLIIGLVGVSLNFGSPPSTASADEKVTKTTKSEPPRTLGGKVVGPDGKPVAAELFLLRVDGSPESLGKANADGTFQLTRSLPENACLIAHANGLGIAFTYVSSRTPAEVSFKMTKDNPIRGRVLDTQGKPVAGAIVFPLRVDDFGTRGADLFVNHWLTRNPQHGVLEGETHIRVKPWTQFTLSDGRTVLATKTAADGTFELRGMGADRVVTLFVRGTGIANAEALVMNRADFDPTAANKAAADNRDRMVPESIRAHTILPMLHAPNVTIVAEQEKIIRGVVKDRDTGKPRTGVAVTFGRIGNMGLLPHPLTATTDKDGRFEIRGSRKYPGYIPEVPGDPENGYLPAQAEASDTAGYAPIEMEILTAKGVVLSGKLIDKETGKPMPGAVYAEPMHENPHLKTLPTMTRSMTGTPHCLAKDDGTYRMVVPPGPVLVMAAPYTVQDALKFKPSQADPKYPQYFREDWGTLMYVTASGSYTTLRGDWCKVIDTPANAKTTTLDIEFIRETRKTVRVVDADGKSIAECNATGTVVKNTYPVHQEGGVVNVYGLEPKQERRIIVCEQRRKLIGLAIVKESDANPVVTLRPGSTVTGRVVDADGKPLVGVSVHLHHTSPQAGGVFEMLHRAEQVMTDASGKFQIAAVVPGHEFRLAFSKGAKNIGPTLDKAPRHTVEKPGETTNLDDVIVKAE